MLCLQIQLQLGILFVSASDRLVLSWYSISLAVAPGYGFIYKSSSFKLGALCIYTIKKSMSSTNRNNTKREICVMGQIYVVIQDPCQCRGLKETHLIFSSTGATENSGNNVFLDEPAQMGTFVLAINWARSKKLSRLVLISYVHFTISSSDQKATTSSFVHLFLSFFSYWFHLSGCPSVKPDMSLVLSTLPNDNKASFLFHFYA